MSFNNKEIVLIDWIIENNKEKKVVEINKDTKKIKYSSKIKLHREISQLTPEEICRAYLVTSLVVIHNYSPELIELEKEYEAGRPKKIKPRIDLILNEDDKNIFYFVEVKAFEKYESDRKYIEGQIFKLRNLENKNVKNGLYFSVTFDQSNNQILQKIETIDLVKYSKFEDWEKKGYPSLSNDISQNFGKPKKNPYIKNSKKDLREKFDKNELNYVQKNLHNVLWGGGGTGDTDIFYALVKLILAKLYDEQSTSNDEEYKFQIFSYSDDNNDIENPDSAYDRINLLYRDALVNMLSTPREKADQLYVVDQEKMGISKIIYAIQSLEEYSFIKGSKSYDGTDLLGDFFETIIRDGFKQTKGQFFTHTNIVRFIIYALKVDDLSIEKINNENKLPYFIDPSAGSGTFLIELMKIVTETVKKNQKDKLKQNNNVKNFFNKNFMPDDNENKWANEFIYGIENNFDLGTAIKVNMILNGDGNANIFSGDGKGDGLLSFENYKKQSGVSVLKNKEIDKYYFDKFVNKNFDIIISNPPFSVDLSNDVKQSLKENFKYSEKRNSENLFIERYYQLLNNRGRMGIVLPESVFDTGENKYIRLFIFRYFNIKAIVSLPQLTFAPFTNTKTSILFAQKKTDSEILNYDKEWKNLELEYFNLFTKINNYIKVYLQEKNETKLPSIKNDSDNQKIINIKNFFQVVDDEKNIQTLLKNNLNLFNLYKIKKPAIANENWVFGKISQKIDSEIYYYHVDEIGYKRTKIKIKVRENELFDLDKNGKIRLDTKLIKQIRSDIKWQ